MKFLASVILSFVVLHSPAFAQGWYPEQGKTVEQYEKESSRWEKMLRELGRK